MTQLSSEKPELFKGRHFNHLLIIQAVRWYVTYKLSYRDVCDLMAERFAQHLQKSLCPNRARIQCCRRCVSGFPLTRNSKSDAVLRQNSIHLRFQQLRLSFSQPKISRSKIDPSVEGSLITAS